MNLAQLKYSKVACTFSFGGLFQRPREGPVLLISRSWTNPGNPLHIEARRRKGPGGPTGLQNRPGSYCGCRRVRLPPPSAKEAGTARVRMFLPRSAVADPI